MKPKSLRLFFLMALICSCTRAHAELAASNCPPIRGQTIVFGGLGSQTSEMQQCYPDFLSVSHDEGSKILSCLAQQINTHPDQKFLIAGHSSGAGDAEKLAQLVQAKNKIHLVLLEGFSYTIPQRKGVSTTCWYAQNSKKGLRGFNAPSMLNSSVCPQPAQAFEAEWCETPMCLHLANVNLKTPSDLSKATVLQKGLASCRGNTAWVRESAAWLQE